MIVATQPQTLLCAALLACAGCSNASAPSTSSAATAAAGSTTITLPAGASGSAAVSGSSGAPIEMPAPAGPVLPQVSDPAQPGPFGVEVVATAPGLDTHKLYVPTKLG